jgi:hypothetical protein
MIRSDLADSFQFSHFITDEIVRFLPSICLLLLLIKQYIPKIDINEKK